jgi:hypothetical protein
MDGIRTMRSTRWRERLRRNGVFFDRNRGKRVQTLTSKIDIF